MGALGIDAGDIGSNAHADLLIWFIFKIGGDQILLPLLVLTFILSRSISRHPTMVNVCCTWILAGIISSLLLYAHQEVGPEPDKALCMAQAVLIMPVPPMTSVAALALVYHTWSTFRPSALRTGRVKTALHSRFVTIGLLAAPYVTHVCWALGTLSIALRDPSKVSRAHNFFYCSIDSNPLQCLILTRNRYPSTTPLALFTACVCLLATILEVHLVIVLSRHWRALRRAGMEPGVDLQLVVRVGIFVTYVFCGMVVMVATVFSPKSVLPDMFAASVGTAFFAVFATQPDVLRVWSQLLRFRRTPPYEPNSPASNKVPISRSPTPLPSFDLDLLQRKDSDIDEKARLAALHAYYNARVHDMGIEVEVIKRPEDAFVVGRGPRRAWGVMGNNGAAWERKR
ncbi:hypothetical protein C8Q79DRAFT_906641 [Trametes meyenii]|nr:hypothetical protein C8Q79DRAFT_906641 [Trametes meyenii]